MAGFPTLPFSGFRSLIISRQGLSIGPFERAVAFSGAFDGRDLDEVCGFGANEAEEGCCCGSGKVEVDADFRGSPGNIAAE